jgi:excisionase family DNA binding protein
MIEIKSNRLSMKEAAQYLGHSYSWLFTKHRSLGLSGYRIGGRWFFDLQDIQEWESNLKAHTQALSNPSGPRKSKVSSVQFV